MVDARVLLVADDLTGAAESAAAFLPRDVRIEAVEGVRESRVVRDVVVVDTDSRYLPEAEAARRCRVALARGPAGAMIVKKIDSTLRGPLAAEVTVLAAGGPVVVATASPALGRTVVGGVVHVHGVPLVRSGVWAAESRPAPESIAAALAPVRSEVVELAAVRGALRALVARLGAVLHRGAVPVCDAETEEDLDRSSGRASRPVARSAGSARRDSRTPWPGHLPRLSPGSTDRAQRAGVLVRPPKARLAGPAVCPEMARPGGPVLCTPVRLVAARPV